MTRSQVAELKRQYMDKRREIMSSRLSALEKKLYDSIFNKLISELDKADGKIVSNGKNIDLANSLDKLFKSFNENEYLSIIKNFSRDLSGISQLNKDYFATISDNSNHLEKVSKSVNSVMSKRIGLSTNGEPIKGGYIDRLIKDDPMKNKIKDLTYKSVTSGKPIDNYIGEIKKIIVGSEKVNGGLQQHFEQFAYDTYNQFDRTTSKLYATKLGLQAFIYQGGKIKTSRLFCKQKDGKVFTTDEAEEWKGMIGQENGPIFEKENYDPLTDCGGYNCRHSIDFISNTTAVKLRPDLKDKL